MVYMHVLKGETIASEEVKRVHRGRLGGGEGVVLECA